MKRVGPPQVGKILRLPNTTPPSQLGSKAAQRLSTQRPTPPSRRSPSARIREPIIDLSAERSVRQALATSFHTTREENISSITLRTCRNAKRLGINWNNSFALYMQSHLEQLDIARLGFLAQLPYTVSSQDHLSFMIYIDTLPAAFGSWHSPLGIDKGPAARDIRNVAAYQISRAIEDIKYKLADERRLSFALSRFPAYVVRMFTTPTTAPLGKVLLAQELGLLTIMPQLVIR